MLLTYSWPGNIRELKNAVERAVYRDEGPVVRHMILDPFRNPWAEESDLGSESELEVRSSTAPAAPTPEWPRDLKAAVRKLEERWLEDAMKEAEDHQGRAAELLGLTYDQFRGLYRRSISDQ